MEDDASTHVLEAIIIALVLLGAAWSVTTLREPSLESDRPRTKLGQLGQDALVLLDGIEESNQTMLERYLTQAYHCAFDAVPSPTSCDGTRGRNLTVKLDYYLPTGAAYTVALDNGVAVRDIYRSSAPAGESTSTTFAFTPVWNTTLIVPELSCYDSGMDANVTMVPLRGGTPAVVKTARLEWAAEHDEAERSHEDPRLWNATMPAVTRPASGTAYANITARGDTTHPGAAAFGTCNLGGTGASLVSSLQDVSFTASSPTAPVATDVTFTADLSPITSLADVSLSKARVVVYEPLPGRGLEPDSHVVASTLVMPAGTAPSVTWTVPEAEPFGAHPVVLEVELDVAGVKVEARRVLIVDVALPSGHVPINPPYRAVLQVWSPEWG